MEKLLSNANSLCLFMLIIALRCLYIFHSKAEISPPLIWFGGSIKGHLKPKWDGQVLAGTTSTAVLRYQRSLIRPIVSGREGISIERTHEYYQVVGNLLKPWLPFELNPGAQKAGLQALEPLGSKKKEEKDGKQERGESISRAGFERRRPFKLLIPNKIEMNSSHGSCTFPRVNYLSLHLPNESAVPVIKQLHFTMASSSSTNTVPAVCSLVPAGVGWDGEREKGKVALHGICLETGGRWQCWALIMKSNPKTVWQRKWRWITLQI